LGERAWHKSLLVSGERTSPFAFPGQIVKALALSKGERVEVDSKDGNIFIRRAIPRFSLEEMFHGKKPEEWRALYADAYDWGRMLAAS